MTQIILIVVGVLIALVGGLRLFLFLLRVVWAWTIPTIFPGLVRDGKVVGQLCWLDAVRLTPLLVLLGALMGGSRGTAQTGKDIKKVVNGSNDPNDDRLTGREREVIKLTAAGLTNQQIAEPIKTSERTVEFHVTNILEKLSIGSRVGAAVWAKERGLV